MTPDKTADESRRVVRPTDARRGEIVRAALAILQEEGAAGVTARALAARSGLALGQVSYHFPSMAEVLSETYRAASAELAAATLSEIAAADTSAEHRLRAFLGAGFRPEFLTEGHLRLRVELWAAARRHPHLADTEAALYDAYRIALCRHLSAFADEAGGDRAAISATGDAIMALLDGLWLDVLRRGDGAVAPTLASALDLAHRHLLPPAGRPGRPV